MARFRHMLILLISLLILLFSCKGKRQAPRQPSERHFPTVEVPQMLGADNERAEWLANHIWDRFLDTAAFYGSDSLKLNGVGKVEVEQQIGTFVTILEAIPPKKAEDAVERTFSLAEYFSRSYPESGMLDDFAELFRKYVYDPASPLRDEELWLAFLEPLLYSEYADSALKASRSWEKRVCEMNRPGAPAPDFEFMGLDGKLHSLYGIKAGWTVLIFGNPDCQACRELVATFRSSQEIMDLIEGGSLKVLDIYIDEDIEQWKANSDSYPKEWTNGYDHLGRINSERIYAVRGIPSIYLLDRNKTIILKDAPEDRLIRRLGDILQKQ